MAERRSFRDIVSNIRFRDNRREVKRTTGYDFFRDDPNESTYGLTQSFIQGYNTSAGNWDIEGLGNGQSNSAVTACLQVLGVAFSEATLGVSTQDEHGEKLTIPNHPLSLLMRRPNPYMSGDVVQQYIINAMHISGDAYLLKQYNNGGQLVALYPLMPSNITPKGNSEELITHYIYEMEEGKVKIDNTDIVHFKMGLDPDDHKTGFSPLKTVLREIYGDESAGQMATALLSNMGVPSILISPKDEYGLTKDEADQISKTYQQKVGGKNKGKPLILSGSMNIEKLSFSPKDLDIGALRQVPEERVSAVLGVPAILAGLGAGLKHATYSNARELREFFTESKLIPLWKMVAEELTQQILLPDYETSQVAFAEYDFSQVRALQTDHNELFERMNIGVQGGWVTVGEARQAVGLPTDESQSYYLMAMGTTRDYQGEYTEEAQVQMPKVEDTPEVVTEDDEENKGLERFEDKVIKRIDDEYCVIAEESGKNMGCYPTRELAKRRLEQISRYSTTPKKAKDEFATLAEAEKRAEELGCSGTHTHDEDGNKIYMPCATHEEYESRLQAYESD